MYVRFIIIHKILVSEVSINVTQSTEGSIIGLAHRLECKFLITSGVSSFLVNISWNNSALLYGSSRIVVSNLTNNASLYSKNIIFLPLLSHDSGKHTCCGEITGFSKTMLCKSLNVMATGMY